MRYQQTPIQPVLLMSTYYSASAPSWMQNTVADGNKGFKQQK